MTLIILNLCKHRRVLISFHQVWTLMKILVEYKLINNSPTKCMVTCSRNYVNSKTIGKNHHKGFLAQNFSNSEKTQDVLKTLNKVVTVRKWFKELVPKHILTNQANNLIKAQKKIVITALNLEQWQLITPIKWGQA
jgi:hypothetical protein